MNGRKLKIKKMNQKKRTQCNNCSRNLNDVGVCPNCGWSYAKEFQGQQELFKKKEQRGK